MSTVISTGAPYESLPSKINVMVETSFLFSFSFLPARVINIWSAVPLGSCHTYNRVIGSNPVQ